MKTYSDTIKDFHEEKHSHHRVVGICPVFIYETLEYEHVMCRYKCGRRIYRTAEYPYFFNQKICPDCDIEPHLTSPPGIEAYPAGHEPRLIREYQEIRVTRSGQPVNWQHWQSEPPERVGLCNVCGNELMTETDGTVRCTSCLNIRSISINWNSEPSQLRSLDRDTLEEHEDGEEISEDDDRNFYRCFACRGNRHVSELDYRQICTICISEGVMVCGECNEIRHIDDNTGSFCRRCRERRS